MAEDHKDKQNEYTNQDENRQPERMDLNRGEFKDDLLEDPEAQVDRDIHDVDLEHPVSKEIARQDQERSS